MYYILTELCLNKAYYYIMDYVILDLVTIFKMLWKDIYVQLHDYLLKTRVEVYPVVCLCDTFLSVCATWNSIQSGKMQITTLECPVDMHYGGNLLYITFQLIKYCWMLLSLMIVCDYI